jgi:alkylated DNA repair dioxygenase AlkB
VQWKSTITPRRRVQQNYGDEGVSYEINFRGKLIKRVVKSWDEIPILKFIRDEISKITGARYNYCVVQRYPNGNVGINPHRDREMKPDTDIAGLSLGATRILTMDPPRYNSININSFSIELISGSLYIY